MSPKGFFPRYDERGAKVVKQVHEDGHPSQIVNRKMTRSYRVPDSFFLGAKVMKKFRGKWFIGTVDELEVDEKTKL